MPRGRCRELKSSRRCRGCRESGRNSLCKVRHGLEAFAGVRGELTIDYDTLMGIRRYCRPAAIEKDWFQRRQRKAEVRDETDKTRVLHRTIVSSFFIHILNPNPARL